MAKFKARYVLGEGKPLVDEKCVSLWVCKKLKRPRELGYTVISDLPRYRIVLERVDHQITKSRAKPARA